MPAAPAAWWNTGDLNASAPNGEVVPPGSSVMLHGLTIREAFASLALQGIIASGRSSSSVVLDVAAEAREYADALIDELAKEPRS